MVGKCKWFNVEKGYGFIAVDGEERDIFVHQSDIYAPGFRSLAEGEPLEFRVMTDEKTGKMKAVDVTGPDGAFVSAKPLGIPHVAARAPRPRALSARHAVESRLCLVCRLSGARSAKGGWLRRRLLLRWCAAGVIAANWP